MGYISMSFAELGPVTWVAEGTEVMELSLSCLLLSVEARDLVGVRMSEILERAVAKPAMIVCTPLSFMAPDSDGRHTVVKAK